MAKVEVKDPANKVTITLDGDTGDISVGGNGQDGAVIILDKNGKAAMRLNTTQIVLTTPDGKQKVFLGATGADFSLGGNGAGGDINLWSSVDKAGGFPPATNPNIKLSGESSTITLRVGGNDTIRLDGQTGDIVMKNADCAEEFDVSASEEAVPGTVMVLDEGASLRQSKEPYDRKVAGVISGAGDYRAGIVLDRKISQGSRMPLALMGKVYCKVDAKYSPIDVGDMLTTSPTPGHAMKATDPSKAFGAVIGKALGPLRVGTGLIPILIALQ